MINLDYAATAPMSPLALQGYIEAAEEMYGNASSLHDLGGRAKELLEASRTMIALALHGDAKGLYFTGSGSEANILAIQSLLNGIDEPHKNEIICSTFEHSSIKLYMEHLKEKGYIVKKISPDSGGRILPIQLEPLLTENTALVTIQQGNSETGILQDIGRISPYLKEKGILFHSDCVQTFCKIPIFAKEWGIDAISISAHKVFGPKGIGAAYINTKTRWQPVLPGTTHEYGFRSGTVNVPGIASFAIAVKELSSCMEENQQQLRKLRNCLKRLLKDHSVNAAFIEGELQLPGIAGLVLENMEGQYALLSCNQHEIAISAGSACQAGMQMPSETVTSLGYSSEEALRFIRVSMSAKTTEDELLSFTKVLQNVRLEAGIGKD
ncbi:IscS subfamily cysteine desulfurase [Metabacillus sp. RGM 3146]|uniref:IscS subfamily cysteine desulfurase n=1 Tax=Metabacillus sp. RGM 3146 TaxID=3401092 RepID=UPI003B9A1877